MYGIKGLPTSLSYPRQAAPCNQPAAVVTFPKGTWEKLDNGLEAS